MNCPTGLQQNTLNGYNNCNTVNNLSSDYLNCEVNSEYVYNQNQYHYQQQQSMTTCEYLNISSSPSCSSNNPSCSSNNTSCSSNNTPYPSYTSSCASSDFTPLSNVGYNNYYHYGADTGNESLGHLYQWSVGASS